MDAIVFNIDHFHLVNEMYGRSTGDKVLKDFADLLMSIFGQVAGIGCRSEADTFYVYCQHQFSYDNIMKAVQDKLSELSETAKIRVRMGIYPNVDKTIEAELWFDRAKRLRSDKRRLYQINVCLFKRAS